MVYRSVERSEGIPLDTEQRMIKARNQCRYTAATEAEEDIDQESQARERADAEQPPKELAAGEAAPRNTEGNGG